MDFEFVTDVTGLPLAKCDIESEAFGDWLSHDVSVNKTTITTLLTGIEQVLNHQLTSYEFTGKIYHLTIADDEVELFINSGQSTHSEYGEDYSELAVAGCGLIECKHLLTSWLEFINE